MTNSIICITGGANGLGRELAAFFSTKNQVVILDIDPKAKVVSNSLGCDFYSCDVSDFDNLNSVIKKILKKYSQIDCFINNAGVFIDGIIDKNDPRRIRKVFEVNCLGPIFASNILVPIFKKQDSGIIVNINSTAGLHPKAGNSVYHASKWALTGFSESLQLELSGSKIKIIDIHPGVMKTDFTVGTAADVSKVIHPEEVVKAIDFVLSLDPKTIIPRLVIKSL
jgi:short-subunit dehydrogenase